MTAYPTYTLSMPGVDDLVMYAGSGYQVQTFQWDPGEAREVVYPRPGMNGVYDTTAVHGQAFITIGLALVPWHEPLLTMERRLRAFTAPANRPTLTIDHGDGAPLVALLSRGRVDVVRDYQPGYRRATVTFAVPLGIMQSVEQHTATAFASGVPAALGFSFDLSFDLTFPADDPEGSVLVTNAGDRDAWPVFRLYGPWSGETSIINDETDLALVFDGENVTAGNYLEVDTLNRTIRLNGDPADSRYSRLVFPDSVWWPLIPGTQRIRFTPTTFSSPAQCQVFWRDAYS